MVHPYRNFDEFDLNYKLFSEAKFILWKLLAIIKYSGTNLADFPVSKTQASLISSNLRDTSDNRSKGKVSSIPQPVPSYRRDTSSSPQRDGSLRKHQDSRKK